MRKNLKSILISFVIAIFFAGFSAVETKAQGVLREILNRMDTNNKSLTSFKSDVTMVKINVQLDEKDTYQGTTSYLPKTAKRATYMRLDWASPQQESILVIGDQYKLYRPRTGTVIIGRVDKSRDSGKVGGALAFMNMSKDQLKANYKVNYVGEESVGGNVRTWHLELIPIGKTSYKSAELWVDGNGMPVQAKIIEPNNDITTVLLSNLQKNVTINTSVFDLKLPKTVKEVRG